MLNRNKQQTNHHHTTTYWIALTGIMMAITLIMKVFILIPIFNGYGIELHIVGYVFGLMLIHNWKWSLGFGLITPWFILIIPPTIVNFYSLLMEYILAMYIFLPFILFTFFIDYTKRKYQNITAMILQMVLFSILMILLVATKLAIHIIAGKLWWLPHNPWYASFIFNLPIYGITLGVILPVSLLVYRPLIMLRQSQI